MSRDAIGIASPAPGSTPKPASRSLRALPPEFGHEVDFGHDVPARLPPRPIDPPDEDWEDEITRPGAVDPGLLVLSILIGGSAALALAAVAGGAAWLL